MMVRTKLFLFASILFILSNHFCEAAQSTQILIFGKTIRPAHASIIPIAGAALENLFLKNGMSALFVQDSDVFEIVNLSNFQTLVLLDVSEGVFSIYQKKSIETYFKNGGGIIAIHSTVAAGKDWPWFQALLGTTFVDHPPIQPATVRLSNINDSANIGLSKNWSQSDEWYNFSNQVQLPAKILATVDESTYKVGKMGELHPVTWSVDLGNGRFWYTALGHSPSLYEDINGDFPKMILQATRWTLKLNPPSPKIFHP